MSITPRAVAFATGIFEKGKNADIPEATAKAIFHEVVADIADSFSLEFLGKSLDEVVKRSVSLYSRYQASAPAEPTIDTENSINIANLLCICQSLGLKGELTQIATKLSRESLIVNVKLFHTVYIPFLKTLKSFVLEKQIDVANSPFRRLFQLILATYLHRYVEAEPQQPKDWARARVGCSCGDCQILNNFLSNPGQKVGRIAVALKRRGHLHTQIEATHPTFTHVTERVGSPQTLVVTKTSVVYQTQHKNWQARREVAKKHIQALGHEDMKVFLGGLHQRIISLSVQTPAQIASPSILPGSGPSAAPALASSANASNRVLPPITRRKVPQTQQQFIVIDDSD